MWLSTAFLSSATNLDSAVFRVHLTVGLFHFRRECICRCDSGRAGETACPCSLVFAVPLVLRMKFSELAVSVTSLSFNRLLLASVTGPQYVCLVLPSATARLPITSILDMVAAVLSATKRHRLRIRRLVISCRRRDLIRSGSHGDHFQFRFTLLVGVHHDITVCKRFDRPQAD